MNSFSASIDGAIWILKLRLLSVSVGLQLTSVGGSLVCQLTKRKRCVRIVPAPKAGEKMRSRTKKSKWRKKRSDSGKKRDKLTYPKCAKKLLASIPTFERERLTHVILVKVGSALKDAVELLAHGNVSSFARVAIQDRVKLILSELDEEDLIREWKRDGVKFEMEREA